MDQSNQPAEPTQVGPPAQPAEPAGVSPPASPPGAEPPPAYPPPIQPPPATQQAWPPPPVYPAAPPPSAYPPAAPPPPGYPAQPWPGPAEPPGPAPGLRLASHGARLVAYIVDVILVGVLVTVVAIVLGLATAGLALGGAEGLAVLTGLLIAVAAFLISLGYFPYFWVNGGATPGMRIFNLRVVRDRDGGPLGWGEAILRLIGLWISGAVFYLGYVWILIDARRRGWHDLIAGTVVIQPG